MMNRQNVEDIYPLSPMQQGMLFHSLYAPNSGVYVEQLGLEICGHLDIASLEQAWQRCVDHHASLRTAFVWEKLEQPLQVVGRQVTIKIHQQDWQSFSSEDQQARLDDWLQADQQQGFALSKAPLMRLTLMQLGKERAYFLWSHHHLLLDGWSAALLLQQVLEQYQAICQGQTLSLEPAPPYRNYIAWLQQQDGAIAERFWRRYLQGLTTPAWIQAQPNRETSTPRHSEQTVQLTMATTGQLQRFGQQHRLTLSTLIQGAWAFLLSRHSGSSEVVFGTTVSGRSPSLSGSEAMIGLLINTLPVRTQMAPGTNLIDWLQQLQIQQAEARQYDYTPLSQIQQWSEIEPGTPLFESLLVVENYPVAPQLGNSSLEIRPMRTVEQTNYPLTAVVELGASLTFKLIYDRDRFGDDFIARFGQHLQMLLENLPAGAQQPLTALSTLPEVERQQLVDWNRTALPLTECSIHELFEQQVERSPDAVALVFETQRLTYQDLNQQANQLAHYLRTVSIGPESLVGICLERSPLMVIALLSTLKAGAAYVPLDPSFPANRLRFMVQDSQIALLITDSILGDRLGLGLEEESHQPQILYLDSVWNLVLQQPHSQLDSPVQASSLAYLIYTSGSTGQPKGVMIEHQSVVNFLLSLQHHLQLTPQDRLLAVTTLSFDIAVLELLLPLTVGAQVAIAPQAATRDAQQLIAAIETHQATVMQATPATWRMLLSAGWSGKADLTLLSGGEALPSDLADQLLTKGKALWNLYGPTETTVWSTLQKVTSTAGGIAIGRPIHNTQIYVLDESLQPVPVGVAAELYIGGAGLARGYWQRPELTAERFIPHPFTAQPSCLYKTGDLARYRADGTLEHLGRLDHQVKLRGYRIELGEIEAVLGQQLEVNAAVVVAREDEPGDPRLVAYVVLSGELDQAQLRERLRSQLPDYMVPLVFVSLEALPLTPNGKVDRLALPKPEAQSAALSSKAEPQTELEQTIAAIWQQVLKTGSIGRDDNFFALGGHSLLATQVISRLQQVFQRDVPIRLLFEAPTVAALAQHLEPEFLAGSATTGLAGAIQPAQRGEPLPLSFAQERLWVLDQLEPGDSSYNISTAVDLTGDLNLPALEQSLNIVIQRHESLRTTFVTVDGLPVQAIAPQLSITLHQSDLRTLPAEQQPPAVQSIIQAEARQPFDLAQGPLLRSQLLHLADSHYVLLFSLHHIIADAWSMGVLIREITTCYRALINGEDPSPPKLPIQYGDLAVWQRQWLQTPNATGISPLQRHIDYWQQQLKAPLPVLQLPTDFPRSTTPNHQGALQYFTLPPELGRLASGHPSGTLHQLSQQQGVSLFMTCLAAFQILLYRYTQQQDMVIGTDVANRNRAETETLIGFLVNLLVLRTDLSGNPTFEDLLSRVREVTLDAYNHQDLPFAKLVEALNPVRSRHQTPLFQVLFVLQNTPMPPLELDHLTLTPLAVDNGTAKFDLALFLTETDQGIQGQWNYRSDLFKPETVARFSQDFIELLQQVVTRPQAQLAELAGISIPSQAMTTPPPQPSKRRQFKTIKSVQPKPIQWSQQDLVRTSYLTAAPSFPLVIEPQDDATDLRDWAENHRPWLEQQLQQHGAILFRGFDLGSALEFEQVAQAICPDLFGDYGDLPREGMGGKVYGSTPYPAEQAIRFHNESSHLHRWPMKIWFFCVQAAQQGGETPIIDCRKAYQLLSPSLRQHLQIKQLMYVRTFTDGLDVSWQAFFQTSDRTAVEAECRRHRMQVEWTAQGLRTRQICPAVLPHPKTGDWVLFNQIQLHHVAYLEPSVRRSLLSVLGESHLPRQVYYGDGSPLEETVLAELDAVYEQSKVQFAWQTQDLLMLDNMLVAHGRNPFVGPRKIVVAMGEMTGDRDGQDSPLGEVSHAATR
ncbi:MAG: amino acid adenylation domain-containing protein [Tildeniella torsiva UHER 1998/13D]|jgi:amino acid adenylation domain-containing protein|nr:amino acid adenylation domain-containing protein [Tildeniella torsiva UHER 1998/13D]